MGAKKRKKLKRPPRWWNVFLGWNPNQGMGRGWRLGIRKAAGVQSSFKKKKKGQ